MATANPMRIMDSTGDGKWPSYKNATSFVPTSSVVTDELGLLLREHKFYRDQNKTAPNRSGSAPPSMGGSFAALGNITNLQSSSSNSSLSTMENFQSEEKLRADPLYLAYYSANVGSNPRLPPPIVSRETRLNHDYVQRSLLATHEEESEEGSSPQQGSDHTEETGSSILMFGQNAVSISGRHKSLVDLIQEDFPRTPSPVYNQSRTTSNVTAEEPLEHDFKALILDTSRQSSNLPEPKPDMDSYGEVAIASGSTPIKNASDSSIGLLKLDVGPSNQDEKSENSYPQHGLSYHIQGSHPQMSGKGDSLEHGHPKIEIQPLLRAPGITPPLYASAAAYMHPGNSVYPNLNPSGIYAPQYSGYAAFLPPYLSGYSPQNYLPPPMQFNSGPGQTFQGQNMGLSLSPTNTSPGPTVNSNTQSYEQLYGHQHGLMMHPPFPDPLSPRYFQQPVQDPYVLPLNYGHLPSPAMSGNSQKDPTFFADQKFQSNWRVGVSSPSRSGVLNSGYLGSPTGLGFVPQFPMSPTHNPVLPGSPVSGSNISTRRYDGGGNFSRNVGWQGQRGYQSQNYGDQRKQHSFLEELKSSGSRRIDLSDIIGRIVEFSIDQHGSRFIQQKLESCTVEEKESVFKEILPHASKLMTDVFGNYVIQKFFEHGTYEQRKELASLLSGQMLTLSLQMYGCRVIQKALEVIELDQKTELVMELDGHVMRCVRDQNGNHVIQKCIECLPTEKIGFIISAFQGNVAELSIHPYGCRVIQRVLENCTDGSQSRFIVDEIMESAYDLAHDQYGNYVTQHVLEKGKPHERSQIIKKLPGKIVPMSQHKYASNVIEKCLQYGDMTERELLIEEILEQSEGNDNLLAMMKDQFANYVVQKILDICNDRQRDILLKRIAVHLHALKKYTYGKHIVARFEQLSGEENGVYEAQE